MPSSSKWDRNAGYGGSDTNPEAGGEAKSPPSPLRGEKAFELSGGVGTAEDAVGDDECERAAVASIGLILKVSVLSWAWPVCGL